MDNNETNERDFPKSWKIIKDALVLMSATAQL